MAETITISSSDRYPVWAGNAPEGMVLRPDDTKIGIGFEQEQPLAEYVNWYMNRTDRRLSLMEAPLTYAEFFSGTNDNGANGHGTNYRQSVIAANASYSISPVVYTVGSGQLRVYLDGVLCRSGAGNQYVEVGDPGSESHTIKFNDAIDQSYEIYATCATTADGNTRAVYDYLTDSFTVPSGGSVYTLGVDGNVCRTIKSGYNFTLKAGTPATESLAKRSIVLITNTANSAINVTLNGFANQSSVFAGSGPQLSAHASLLLGVTTMAGVSVLENLGTFTISA